MDSEITLLLIFSDIYITKYLNSTTSLAVIVLVAVNRYLLMYNAVWRYLPYVPLKNINNSLFHLVPLFVFFMLKYTKAEKEKKMPSTLCNQLFDVLVIKNVIHLIFDFAFSTNRVLTLLNIYKVAVRLQSTFQSMRQNWSSLEFCQDDPRMLDHLYTN